MTRGGARPGAGRPPGPGKPKIPGLKMRSIRLTDTEYAQVKSYIKRIRAQEQQGSGSRGESEMTQYKGKVIDQMKTMETRETKWYPTYKEAHDAAEKLCKRTMGDRGTIEVEQKD